jgi:hypothetical protein
MGSGPFLELSTQRLGNDRQMLYRNGLQNLVLQKRNRQASSHTLKRACILSDHKGQLTGRRQPAVSALSLAMRLPQP